MNAADLNKLPRYIEAPNGGMWRIPEGFEVAAREDIYVRMLDVLSLVEKGKNNGNES